MRTDLGSSTTVPVVSSFQRLPVVMPAQVGIHRSDFSIPALDCTGGFQTRPYQRFLVPAFHTLLTVLTFLTFLSAPALCAPYGGGSGTPEDPYQIWTAEQISDMASHPEDWSNWECYILMADIDLGGYNFSPIGSREFPFKASVNGNHYAISNVTIDKPQSEYVGLIGYGWSSIFDLNLLNVSVRGKGYVGGLIGLTEGWVGIANCTVTGSVIGSEQSTGGFVGGGGSFENCSFTGFVSGKNGVGGLSGSDSGSITNCRVSGNIDGQNDFGSSGVGGMVGFCSNTNISDSNFDGIVTGKYCVGGIAGLSKFEGDIHNCISNCNLSGDAYVGGIVGYITNSTCASGNSIRDCQVSGKITAGGGVGGIVGVNEYNITKCTSTADIIGNGWNQIGGICGVVSDPIASDNDWPIISDCSSTGSVTGLGGASCIGGLVGNNNSGLIRNSYATGNVSGKLVVGGLVGSDSVSTGNDTIFSIIDCYATGSVTGEEYVGGLIGQNESNTVTTCYATGPVIGSASVGGLAGWNSGVITSCYAVGPAGGMDSVGGLMGTNSGSVISCYAIGSVNGTRNVGGLVGLNNDDSISNCYSAGAVTGGTYVGGLIGYNPNSVTNSFWDTEKSGQQFGIGYGSLGGISGKSTAQMKTQNTYTSAGWDFASVWMICDGKDYPHLLWEGIQCNEYSGIMFIDSTAPGNELGTSWENAIHSLKDALMMAQPGTEVRVAQGTYKPDQFFFLDRLSMGRIETFPLRSGVIIKGGYAGTTAPNPDDRDPVQYPTILSGDLSGNDSPATALKNLRTDPSRNDNAYHVVTAEGVDNTAVLDGFTITAGQADGPAAQQLHRGGGLSIDQASPTVINCVFTRNAATSGGAVCAYTKTNASFSACRFTANAAIYGGGLSVISGLALDNCSIIGNFASYGGGLYASSALRAFHTLIAQNSAIYDGGGVYISASTTTLTNCTIADNASRTSGTYSATVGGGVFSVSTASAVVANSILWGNTSCGFGGRNAQIFGPAKITHSTVQDWYGSDPLFANPAAGDYRLKSRAGRYDPTNGDWIIDAVTSPAIDAGSPFDLVADEPAPNGGRINQGFDGGTIFASKSPNPYNIADLNHDDAVNLLDLAIVAENWLK